MLGAVPSARCISAPPDEKPERTAGAGYKSSCSCALLGEYPVRVLCDGSGEREWVRGSLGGDDEGWMFSDSTYLSNIRARMRGVCVYAWGCE